MGKCRAHELVPGVSVGVDLNHPDGSVSSQSTKNGQSDRVIATRRDGYDAGGVEATDEARDVAVSRLDLVDPGEGYVAGIADSAELVGVDAADRMDGAHHA